MQRLSDYVLIAEAADVLGVCRAGLKPWAKLFHNLRASRQTELENDFPSHVVCKWIGNSERIARKHYLQVTEAHYAKAVDEEAGKTTQKTTQQIAAVNGIARNASHGDPQADLRTNEKPPAVQGFADDCDDLPTKPTTCQNVKVGDAGLEPATSWV